MIFETKKYKHLIIKYLQGDATQEEQKQVEDFIARSARNKQLFESYRGLLFLTQKKKVEYNADRAWEKVRVRILANEDKPVVSEAVLSRPVKKYTIRHYAVTAAAAVVVIVFGLFQFLQNDEPTMTKFASGLTAAEPDVLPDGTVVALNANTTVNFPTEFDKDIREVSIFGEAFFEVKPDPEKPFIIHASGLNIKVLGTSFNVEAYPGSDFVKVTVNTGKVLVYPEGKEESNGKQLTAGEIATYSQKSGVIFKGVNDDLNVLSWKTGVLTFRETRLAEVFKAFEQQYQKQFIIEDSTILNQRLTARFDNQSLDDALETLSLIFNIKFEKKERHIMVH